MLVCPRVGPSGCSQTEDGRGLGVDMKKHVSWRIQTQKGALQHVSPALIIPQLLFSLPTALTSSAALRADQGVGGKKELMSVFF